MRGFQFEGENPVALLYFNKDGYSVYCRKYKEYRDWVARRNEAREKLRLEEHDACFSFVADGKGNSYRRHDPCMEKRQELLLGIKEGRYEYEELLQKAERLKNGLPHLYGQSGLPDEPDVAYINALLVK